MIVSGGGVIFSDGVKEAVALAEQLQAPVVNSYLHNDSFPASHPLWCGPLGYQGSKAAMKLIKDADVVLALGTRLGPFGTLPQHGLDYWPKNAKIIQVDSDHRMLGLVKQISVGIVGDAKEAAKALSYRLANRKLASSANADERKKRIKAEKDAWEKELTDWTHEKDAWSLEISKGSPYMHPRQMLRELEKAMPKNAMVSTDIGNICSVSNSYLRFEQPNSMFAAMSFGNCGYALPSIIGAKVAAPDRPAVAYVGDGAWGMSFGEILTCVREDIPVTAVVFHNKQWGAEKKNQVDFYDTRFLGVNLKNPSWAEVARSLGAEGVTVDKLGDVGEALDKACDAQKKGKTTVIEVMVTQELGDPFRRDALKYPQRVLDKYKATNVKAPAKRGALLPQRANVVGGDFDRDDIARIVQGDRRPVERVEFQRDAIDVGGIAHDRTEDVNGGDPGIGPVRSGRGLAVGKADHLGMDGPGGLGPQVEGALDGVRLENVEVTDEARDGKVCRTVVDLRRRADLRETAGLHHRDAIAQKQCLFLVMGDEHGGKAHFALQALQFFAQALADLRIERRQGLIEQEELRLRAPAPGPERRAVSARPTAHAGAPWRVAQAP